MEDRGVRMRPKWQNRMCPYCCKNLGRMEMWKRKLRKTCRCRECGRVIDERNIVW